MAREVVENTLMGQHCAHAQVSCLGQQHLRPAITFPHLTPSNSACTAYNAGANFALTSASIMIFDYDPHLDVEQSVAVLLTLALVLVAHLSYTIPTKRFFPTWESIGLLRPDLLFCQKSLRLSRTLPSPYSRLENVENLNEKNRKGLKSMRRRVGS